MDERAGGAVISGAAGAAFVDEARGSHCLGQGRVGILSLELAPVAAGVFVVTSGNGADRAVVGAADEFVASGGFVNCGAVRAG